MARWEARRCRCRSRSRTRLRTSPAPSCVGRRSATGTTSSAPRAMPLTKAMGKIAYNPQAFRRAEAGGRRRAVTSPMAARVRHRSGGAAAAALWNGGAVQQQAVPHAPAVVATDRAAVREQAPHLRRQFPLLCDVPSPRAACRRRGRCTRARRGGCGSRGRAAAARTGPLGGGVAQEPAGPAVRYRAVVRTRGRRSRAGVLFAEDTEALLRQPLRCWQRSPSAWPRAARRVRRTPGTGDDRGCSAAPEPHQQVWFNALTDRSTPRALAARYARSSNGCSTPTPARP